MLNKTWRIVLLIVALLLALWPSLLGEASQWVAAIALVVLLVAEFNCDTCAPKTRTKAATPARAPARSSAKKKTTARKKR